MGKLIDTNEAAEVTGLAAETMTSRRSKGLAPAFYRIGRRVMYDRDELEAWVASQRVEPKALK